MKYMLGFAVVFLGLMVSCSNKIEGDVTIDDARFAIESCASGQRNGFFGVDLKGSDGRLLRLVQLPSGEPQVFLFAAGGSSSADLGPCGSLSVEIQNSTINDIKNIRGQAQLNCTSDEHQVKGSVTFENCH